MSESVAAREAEDSKTLFGFWVYLMTDCVLFASLFATFIVLRNNSGLDTAHLFSMPFVLAETIILLTSSFTCGLAMLATQKRNVRQVIGWLVVTSLLGAAFLTMEMVEFTKLVHEGHGWTSVGFFSAFFTLVGTHGLHIAIGLLWMIAMVIRIAKVGLVHGSVRKLTMLSLFWHFLDVVWIFIFSIVYLLGVSR